MAWVLPTPPASCNVETNDRSVLDAVFIASGGVSSRLVDKTAGWLIQVETMWNRTESQKVN
jgi:hypothetical protein